MATHKVIKGTYGPGSYSDAVFTPLPAECRRLLQFFTDGVPDFFTDGTTIDDVKFVGEDLPLIPGPLKSQAISAAFHAMVGLLGKQICSMKGIDTGDIRIDVDQAGLYPATAAIVSIDGKGPRDIIQDGTLVKVGKDVDKGWMSKNDMHFRSWAIYQTKDPNVWYQLMSNMDPPGFLKAYGLDSNLKTASRQEAYDIIGAEVKKYSAAELDMKNMENGFCGQTCYTPEQWRQTTMGRRLKAHPLFNYSPSKLTADLPPAPFPSVTADSRPLAGIKIVELTRVIAGPAMGAYLASLGAEIIRIQCPDLPDFQLLSITLTAGRKNLSLDLKQEADKQKLWSLLQDADVFIQAFRLGALSKKGFTPDSILAMAAKRNKGIIIADLNCYGPDGYYAERPGFQQIADAASGCSYVVGQSLGFEAGKSVLPPLPVADMLSGVVGVIDVLLALRDRARFGGSYRVAVALTAVDAVQLEEKVGLYSPEAVARIQEKYGFAEMTPDLHVEELLFVLLSEWMKKSDVLQRKEFICKFEETAWGKNHTLLAPVVKYENKEASPAWKTGPAPFCQYNDMTWA